MSALPVQDGTPPRPAPLDARVLDGPGPTRLFDLPIETEPPSR